MASLLQKTREINNLIQSSSTIKVDFEEVADKVSRVLECNAFIVSKRGKLLGIGQVEAIENDRIVKMFENRQFPEEYVSQIMRLTETRENIAFEDELTIFPTEDSYQDSETCIVPIYGGGNRLGTLILGRSETEFSEDDLVLAEYTATVVGMEILREKMMK